MPIPYVGRGYAALRPLAHPWPQDIRPRRVASALPPPRVRGPAPRSSPAVRTTARPAAKRAASSRVVACRDECRSRQTAALMPGTRSTRGGRPASGAGATLPWRMERRRDRRAASSEPVLFGSAATHRSCRWPDPAAGARAHGPGRRCPARASSHIADRCWSLGAACVPSSGLRRLRFRQSPTAVTSVACQRACQVHWEK